MRGAGEAEAGAEAASKEEVDAPPEYSPLPAYWVAKSAFVSRPSAYPCEGAAGSTD